MTALQKSPSLSSSCHRLRASVLLVPLQPWLSHRFVISSFLTRGPLQTDDEDQADIHEAVRDKTGAEAAYGTVLPFTLISILHILGLVLEVVEDLQTRFDGVQLAPERRQDLTDTMKLLGVRASQKPYKVAIVGRTGIVLLFLFR